MHCAARAGGHFKTGRGLLSQTAFTRSYSQANAKLMRRELLQNIKSGGPITVSEFMKNVNTHPKYGYYSCKEIFGEHGDFCTAPEYSQLFGEVIALSIISALSTQLSSVTEKPIRLFELGPGKGTMMQDILRTISKFPMLMNRIVEINLVESSRRLALIQEKALRLQFPSMNFKWHHTVDDCIPNDSSKISLFISNEFFDALPILLFLRNTRNNQFEEILVDAIDVGDDVNFRFVASPGPTGNTIFYNLASRFPFDALKAGDQYLEVCPEATRISKMISECISQTGGLFLAVDYGVNHSLKSHPSLRAIKNHRILKSPLDDVGDADLSADVDFVELASHFPKDRFIQHGTIDQGVFLQQFGIVERLKALIRMNKDVPLFDEKRLVSGADILINPEKMGSAYKVFLAISKT